YRHDSSTTVQHETLIGSNKRKYLTKENCSIVKKSKFYCHYQSNSIILQLIELLKPYLEHYKLSSLKLCCYIKLHLPNCESGNNQGVKIQLQVLKEIQDMEIIVGTNYDLLLDYYKRRLDTIKLLNKYPTVEDYYKCLQELDLKIFDDIRFMILELRTIYLKTYDIIMKNLTRIQTPRSSPHTTMIN
ncbi:unnamed protein product, partial [Didymodactylos carnosus]